IWAEVRTLVIGEVQPAVREKGKMVVHTRNLSYFSRKVNSEEFETASLGEIHRRGVANAKAVAAVMDGAEWLQSFTDYHCRRAVRILDFTHAAEHINPAGEFLYGERTEESKTWLKEELHQLKHEGPKKLLLELQKLQKKYPEAKPITGNYTYF
ncbi:MAG: ISKra4 family transposase, partial [Chloroflexota bacterium]